MQDKKKTTIIFDLDGLLIDSEIISYQIDNDLLKKYGHAFTVEEYATNYSGKTGLKNMQNMIQTYQLPITVEEGLDFFAKEEKEYFQKGVQLKKGARELLSYLKDNQYNIVMASSSKRERALGVLKQNGIADYFSEMVFGTEIEHGKPAPDIFLIACEKAGATPDQCLVLEDSEAGIQAAHAAKMDVICIPDMKKPAEEIAKMATEIFTSLEGVISWLG